MGKGGMPGSEVTVAEVLRDAGYATGLIGKWHIGYEGDRLPNAQGFDYFYGHRGGKIDYFKHTDTAQKEKGNPLGKHDFYENDRQIFPEGYSTHLFTKRAIQFVQDNKQTPFFLFLAYNAPHYARPGVLQAPEEYIRKFAGDQKPTRRQLYAAMVSCMDDGIGELLTALEQNGLAENTLVMFISDNGGDPSNGGRNLPFVGGKWKYDEGGIRVPMIAKWPGRLPAGKTCDQPVHMIDLFPTTLGATGIPMPADVQFDGLDVMDVLAGDATLPERPLFFADKAVRRGNWKLINGRLIDLTSDLQARNDLAQQQPDIAGELQRLLAARQTALKGNGLED
jgi:arylsulfatase A-like enzyme